MSFLDVAGGIATGGLWNAGKAIHGATQIDLSKIPKVKTNAKESEITLGKHYGELTDEREAMMRDLLDRNAAQVNQAPQDQFRQQQMGLMGALQARATGQSAGAGEALLQQQRDANLNSAMALARSGGGNPMLATRQAQQAAGQANLQTQQQAAVMAAQEQAAAEQAMTNVAQGGRAADIGLATSNAQLLQQDQQGKDQIMQGFMQQGLSIEQARMAAELEYARLKQNAQAHNQAAIADAMGANTGATTKLVGGVLGGGAQALTGMVGG